VPSKQASLGRGRSHGGFIGAYVDAPFPNLRHRQIMPAHNASGYLEADDSIVLH
jgi:hypothetical protein